MLVYIIINLANKEKNFIFPEINIFKQRTTNFCTKDLAKVELKPFHSVKGVECSVLI